MLLLPRLLQTLSSPSDEDESMDQTLIKCVPWEEHAVDLPNNPEEIKRMMESIAIVADASAHAYGKHEGPDITEIIDFSDDVLPDIQSDKLSGYCPFDSSNAENLPTLHCVESVDTLSSNISEVELPEHLQVLFLQTVDNKELSQDAEEGLKQLLLDHQDTFAKSKTDIGLCTVVQHDIDTGDTKPIKQSPRRPPLNSGTAEDEIIDEMLSSGVIQPSDSAWASPVCLVRKKRQHLSILHRLSQT